MDLFSGIGGFSQGLKQAGFKIKKHYFAEVDEHAQAIYKNQFKDAIGVGDVRHVRGSELGNINTITFGSPCQDFSLAGKRRGMDGERSSLITEAIKLINECRPDFFIWENVKGTFSSNDGADFWAIIQAFANIGGYRLEWQLLNTAWFLPQNRERIYLVGRIAGKCEGQVFPIAEKTKRIDERSKQTTNDRNLTAGGHSGGLHSSMALLKVGDYRSDEGIRWRADGNAPTMQARARTDGSGQAIIKIKSATSCGYEQAQIGDSINYSVPKSETRRGRVGKCKAQTLDTACKQATIEGDRIRRLTEIECERLQGFEDDWSRLGNYDGEVKEVSASQRYKCLGNAVTVDVVQAVGESILRATA